MKIYPSKHRVNLVKDANRDKDITVPLAYLNEDHDACDITYQSAKDFDIAKKDTKTKLIPLMELRDQDVLIFDELENPVDSTTFINKIEDKYYYYPNNTIEFTPLKFGYEIIVKKHMLYKSDRKFNLKVTILDDEEKLDFANRLSQILINPAGKNDVKDNIIINDNIESLTPFLTIKDDTDIVFLESEDGIRFNFPPENLYDEQGTDLMELPNTLISPESFLNQNKNLWIVSDEHYQYPVTRGIDLKVRLKDPKIMDKGEDIGIHDYYNLSEYRYKNVKVHNIFNSEVCPILIIEHENQGFCIYSSSEIFAIDKIDYYKNLIHEVMLYVYCNSYKTSERQYDCITYDIPDYEYVDNRLTAKNYYVTKKTISDMVHIRKDDFTLMAVNIFDNNDTLAIPDQDLVSTVDQITCKWTSDKTRLIFELNNNDKNNNVYYEPERPKGWTSILYNNKVYYTEANHYLIETNIKEQNKLYLIENDQDLVVRLYPIKSSKYGLNITKDMRLTIPSIKTLITKEEENTSILVYKNDKYVVYIDDETRELCYLFESDYQDSSDKIKIATIILNKKHGNKSITDIRRRGGGLPLDMPDNFNLLDIGHIYGRPYRQANTLVITLPKKYEMYKDEILEVINKYKVAEDYPILFFEDDETDGEI
jgi:hypothetical protein